MAENMLDFVAPIEDKMQNIIQVIGVGGGGCNAVSRMDNEGIQGVAFAQKTPRVSRRVEDYNKNTRL